MNNKNNKYPEFFKVSLEALKGQFSRESTRGFIILGSAWIEFLIDENLKSFFVRENFADYFLNKLEFSNRLRIALELKVISKKFKEDLVEISKIRNKFAHYKREGTKHMAVIQWSDDEIQKKAKTLVNRFSKAIDAFPEIKNYFLKQEPDELKAQYQMVLALIIYHLDLCIYIDPEKNREPFYLDHYNKFLIEFEKKLKEIIKF